MAIDIREWKETLYFPKEGWLNGLLKRKDQYEVIFREREADNGIRYFIAWVNLPGKLKDAYEFEGNRSGHLIGTDNFEYSKKRALLSVPDQTALPEIEIKERITAIIKEHIQFQKEKDADNSI